MFYGFDPVYLIIIGVCTVLSLVASGYVKLKFSRGQQVTIRSGRSGAEIARMILRDQDIADVEVVEHQGFLSDHYHPTKKTLNLSPDVYHGTNAAAAGVAAHEVGHAIQHAQGDITMWGRSVLVYPANFGSMLGPVLVMIGLMLAAGHAVVAGTAAYYVAVSGVMLFGIATLCSIVIVFNEFNASSRARVALLRLGVIDHGQEEDTVRGVLNAAGLTYLAAAVAALAQLLYWAWRAGLIGGGRRN
ncbi:MAG: zinc metallopeptidase [Planctomycetes bacterium]|nr:zinc metallopeptidase [Planctomycetota bacterium]